MSNQLQREVKILLVEDDDVDAEAIIRGFRLAKVSNSITVANDGVEALEVLRGGDGMPRLDRPNVILLDLNMPRMNGIEFLKELREDPDLTDTIVFVLTTSDDEKDRWHSYRSHIAGYMVKSEAGPSFTKTICMLEKYWSTVILPE